MINNNEFYKKSEESKQIPPKIYCFKAVLFQNLGIIFKINSLCIRLQDKQSLSY